jgi:hypothetical protein
MLRYGGVIFIDGTFELKLVAMDMYTEGVECLILAIMMSALFD